MRQKTENAEKPEYSRRISELRVLLGLSARRMAEEMGVSKIAVLQWIQGNREPRASNYIALANLAGKLGYRKLEEFFREQKSFRVPRQSANQKFAVRYFDRLAASMTLSPSEMRNRLIELSHLAPKLLAERQAARIIEAAKQGSSTEVFAEKFYQITFETEAARLVKADREG